MYRLRAPGRRSSVWAVAVSVVAFALASCSGGTPAGASGDATVRDGAHGDTATDLAAEVDVQGGSVPIDAGTSTSPCGGSCTNPNPCVQDLCNTSTGQCEYPLLPDGTTCGCHGEGSCQGGVCQNATPVCTSNADCNDFQQCTLDQCLGGCRCSHTLIRGCTGPGGLPP